MIICTFSMLHLQYATFITSTLGCTWFFGKIDILCHKSCYFAIQKCTVTYVSQHVASVLFRSIKVWCSSKLLSQYLFYYRFSYNCLISNCHLNHWVEWIFTRACLCQKLKLASVTYVLFLGVWTYPVKTYEEIWRKFKVQIIPNTSVYYLAQKNQT